jgi:predicted phage baseplate assembly protein
MEDADTDEYRLLSFPVGSISERSRNAYGLSGETTVITLGDDQSWWPSDQENPPFTSLIRGTTVFAQSELLELAEAPITAPVSGLRLELDGLYDGLETGRWIVVSGERDDITGASGVTAQELVMIAGIEQRYDPSLQGDSAHTSLVLANEGLSYEYKRDTVTFYANVVKATHGETRQEVLGSGDGAQAFQRFDLKQGPLTYVAAPNPDGVASTLEVRVDGVRWHEAEMLFALEPGSRSYITQADNEQKTTVVFGDGKRGARPPSGMENVRAVYRSGIGKPGNVGAGQISMLVTRPLGVKGVNNPLRASGGADAESRDMARRNTPLATMALDRLVSLQDYEDFARTFAGIGKASATMLSDGRRRLVHLTIAGAEDIPIDKNSDLYRNLRLALQQSGDPFQPFQVQTRNLVALIISARVRLHPDYAWDAVVPQIRSALLEAFGFERRELGQDAHLSEALRVIQGVGGVTYVDVDIFEGLSETVTTDALLLSEKLLALSGVTGNDQPKQHVAANLARVDEDGILQPAQLAFLNPQTPDTLILTEIH